MIDASWIQLIDSGGNLAALAIGLAVMDIRGKIADIRRRIDVIEYKQEAR